MTQLLDLNEHLLLQRLRDGDASAFEILYNSYKTRLAANLFKLLKSWDQVEETLQELFVRVWQNRSRIDPDKSFQAYLYRIAINLVNDYYRKVASDRELVNKLWENVSALYTPETLQEQIRADEELMRTIEKLPERRMLVFKLCKLEGKSYAEVSKFLQISEAAVNDHITKANKFIFENYNKSLPIISVLMCTVLMEGV